MRWLIATVVAVLLLSEPGFGDWTAPVVLPTDTLDASAPVGVGLDTNRIWAAYVVEPSALTTGTINGSFFDGTNWTPTRPLAGESLSAVTCYAVARDSARDDVWLAFYHGNQGIYTTRLDSSGPQPPELAWRDSTDLSIAELAMQVNGAGRPGIMMANEGFYHQPSSVWYIERRDSGWTPRVCIAEGMAQPPLYTSMGQPCIAGDTGDSFFMSYTETDEFDPYSTALVHVLHYPDGTELGRFQGSRAQIVFDPSSRRLWLACQDSAELMSTCCYTTAGGWSSPVVPDSSDADIWFALDRDALGYVWLAYGTSQGIMVRHASDTEWSEPELVFDDPGQHGLTILSDKTGIPWVLWRRDLASSHCRVVAAHRTTHLGVGSGAKPLPSRTALIISPTIGRSRFSIRLTGPVTGRARIRIYDAAGRLVRTWRVPAVAELVWDGTDAGHHDLPSGVYYCCLDGESVPIRRKLILER